ncbi:MAG: sulfotransferase domain-containing protein [Cycloclasticus sp.]|nr:sulfotransferase domain-containing protein [Cycloclasticus sp.]
MNRKIAGGRGFFTRKSRAYVPPKLPRIQKSSDVYIVEFPRSGITWLSSMLANTCLIESGCKQRATFYNIQQLIPDIHMSEHIANEPMWDAPKFRFIKSHSEYCSQYNHVIYLLRNPLSVMRSYYLYSKSLKRFSGEFLEFVKDDVYGVSAWIRHVDSWLLRGDSSQRVHLIKYEELKEDTFSSLKMLYLNLGVLVDDATIKEVVKLSSFEAMQESEKMAKIYNPNLSLKFVREGETFSSTVDDIDVENYILDATFEIRSKLGYREKLFYENSNC